MTEMFASYVSLKKTFDSEHREALWDLLRLRGIPARILDHLIGQYSETECAVRSSPMIVGMRQSCVLDPLLFVTCMDWLLGRVVGQSLCGVSVGSAYQGYKPCFFFSHDAVIPASLWRFW